MTTTILLIRHAAHVDLDLRLSGRGAGVALSAAGERQAAALGTRLAGECIDRIECSPLDRTRTTAAAIATAGRLPPPRVVDALIEIDMGDWTGRRFDAMKGDHAWDAWNAHRGTARIPGGETMAEAQARIVAHLDRLVREDEGATLALVTHADMVKAAVAHVIGLPLDHLLRLEVGPASVTRLVLGDWGGRLLGLNQPVG